jgi:alkylated DNA repair dioxygenase AlkB
MEDITLIKGFLSPGERMAPFRELSEKVNWHEELTSTIDGSKVKINRKMAYIYKDEVDYTYANLTFKGEKFVRFPHLCSVLDKLCYADRYDFNSVLLNLYKDGKETINWHSDKEEIIGPNPIIACINLGATRKFWFRKKEKGSEKFFYEVEDGDLLVMGENCQTNYLHAILKEPEITEPRISLTFRKVNL